MFEPCLTRETGLWAIRDRMALSWECVLGRFSEDSPSLRRVRVLPAALAPLQVRLGLLWPGCELVWHRGKAELG